VKLQRLETSQAVAQLPSPFKEAFIVSGVDTLLAQFLTDTASIYNMDVECLEGKIGSARENCDEWQQMTSSE
jgi:hypothetical protein